MSEISDASPIPPREALPNREDEPVLFIPDEINQRKGWLYSGGRLDATTVQEHSHKAPWYLVIWLTGVDYFSTLGYQPGIALLAAGAIAPLATLILVLVTLFCALPIYAMVAKRSYVGQGSLAMLENLIRGWSGKLFILTLLGFAATDFVITITLSAADAAKHAIENPLLQPYLGHGAQIPLTLLVISILGAVFLKGFREAIGLSTLVCIPYLILNSVVLTYCVQEIVHHPELIPNWKAALAAQGDWAHALLAALLLFPKLALGLSGFETGVSVMPLIQGGEADREATPRGRIRNAQRLLATAAIIMCVMLLVSSFVVTLLIPEAAYQKGGEANGRAIAYLAHEYLGPTFGTIYDVSTVIILGFAGASAIAGLLNLIPRYLPRFGMAPLWVAYPRPLVLAIFAACVVVTLAFKADVDAQGGAYATGVLVLMTSAAVAVAIAAAREKRIWLSRLCWGIFAVFAYTLIENVRERPDGVVVASFFILTMIVISGVSRYQRATELRLSSLTFVDETSEILWDAMKGKKVNLVPITTNTHKYRVEKTDKIRKYYGVDGPLAFVHINMLDNQSEFLAPLRVQVRKDGDHFSIEVFRAVAIPNSIAVISELIDPISLFIGLTRSPLMGQSLRYLLFGQGETGLMVYAILIRHWDTTHEHDVRPRIFLMSE
jgi:hypothetical protein